MCAFSERRKKNLRPHDTIKMVCNIHNGALLLCPAKLSRHTPAIGWRLAVAKKCGSRARALEAWAPAASAILVPRLAAAAHVALGAHARTRSHILHYSPLFPDNFCNAKVVAAAIQRARLAGL